MGWKCLSRTRSWWARSATSSQTSLNFPYLERYHKNPLFRGIRCGNLWGRDFTKASENPAFISGLKLLAQADLVMDTANPRITLLEAVVRITDQVPNLRVVIDHLPSMDPTDAEQPVYERLLAEIGKRPQIYVKHSAVAHRVNGQVSMNEQLQDG